jgi:hypothetical protein
LKDWDSFPGNQWWSRCRFIDLDSPYKLSSNFLGFLLRSWVGSGLSLASPSPRRAGTSSVEGSLSASPLGGWVETGIFGIGMSPSKPGMGELKLSKACIQVIKV